MTRDEIIATARHAAALHGLFPDTDTHPPEIIEGAAATTVLMATPPGKWLICVHLRGAANHDWHVTGSLPPLAARANALAYANDGL